jgi:uncharacterized membrane protein YfcA
MTFSLFLLLVLVVALLAGAIATVTGFGIGSLLTPILGVQLDMKTAVAVVSIPHMVGTAVRMWILRRHLDSRLLWSFGLTSAAGGITGALLHSLLKGPLLSAVLGSLLILVGLMELSGLARRIQFRGWAAWVAGAVSGLLGGLVGNQGGIRTGAMLGFHVPKEAFVATGTAVGLMVDFARVPVYLVTHGKEIVEAWPFVGAAVVGVIAGTLLGHRVLKRIPETTFRKVVSVVLLLLGTALLSVEVLRAMR